ncbi:MAG: hypothetical protein AVDCRST_MAG93-8294, partial [uncultured Chloroflexia bacterium]
GEPRRQEREVRLERWGHSDHPTSRRAPGV